MAAARRPPIGKPLVASVMASPNRSFHGSLPCSFCTRSIRRGMPTVPIERPLARRSARAGSCWWRRRYSADSSRWRRRAPIPGRCGLHGTRAGVVVEHEAAPSPCRWLPERSARARTARPPRHPPASPFLSTAAAGRAGIGVRRRHHIGLRVDGLEPLAVAGCRFGRGWVAGLVRSPPPRCCASLASTRQLVSACGAWWGVVGGVAGLSSLPPRRSDQQGTGNGGGQRQRVFWLRNTIFLRNYDVKERARGARTAVLQAVWALACRRARACPRRVGA